MTFALNVPFGCARSVEDVEALPMVSTRKSRAGARRKNEDVENGPVLLTCLTATYAGRLIMPMSTAPPSTVQTASARISLPVPIRRGSVSERFVKCSKARVSLRYRWKGTAWSLLQLDTGGEWQDAVTSVDSRAGCGGEEAN